jgi:hypothetical protein
VNVELPPEVIAGLQRVADLLGELLTTDPRSLASLILLARDLPDHPALFPQGPHKTLVELEAQLDLRARNQVTRRLTDRQWFDP